MPTVREIPDQDACANCDHLRWGPDQGWDKCAIDGHGINWAKLKNLVCECHKRSTAEDPRTVKKSVFEETQEKFERTTGRDCTHNCSGECAVTGMKCFFVWCPKSKTEDET